MSENRAPVIKQIIPVEPGWTFHYLWYEDGEVHLGTLPVTAQAVVRRYYDGDIEIEDEVDFVVVHSGRLALMSDCSTQFFDDLSINLYPLGAVAPNDARGLDDYKWQTKRLLEKVEKNRDRYEKSVAAIDALDISGAVWQMQPETKISQ